MRRETNRKRKNCKNHDILRGGGVSVTAGRCPARVVGRSPPGDYFPYPVRGLDEHSLFKREAVWSSLEISASLGFWGARGGVENGDFHMFFSCARLVRAQLRNNRDAVGAAVCIPAQIAAREELHDFRRSLSNA